MNLIEHLKRQIAFSRATFGPGARREGVIDHIRKELVEVEEATNHVERVKEWTDVVILALDGLTRELALISQNTDATAAVAVSHIVTKQNKNESRDWPDWRTADPSKAIEHVKGDGSWIEWDGGEMPFAPSTRVEIKFRNGNKATWCTAGIFRWNHLDSPDDIVEYRLMKGEQK